MEDLYVKNYIMEIIPKYGNNCCRVTIIRKDLSIMLFFFQIFKWIMKAHAVD